MAVIVAFDLEGLKHEQGLLCVAEDHYRTRRHELIRDWADQVVASCPAWDVPVVELRMLEIAHLVGGLGGLIRSENRRYIIESLIDELTYQLEQSWFSKPRTYGLRWKLAIHGNPDRGIPGVKIQAVAK